MKKILVFFLVFIAGNVFSENTIIGLINTSPILLNSIQSNLFDSLSKQEKITIVNEHVDTRLQIEKAEEFYLIPTEDDIDNALMDIAIKNNISFSESSNFDNIEAVKKEISDKLSILNLRRHITKDIEYPTEQIKQKCQNRNLDKDIKQIKIAQIIISEINSDTDNLEHKNKLIKSFLSKLSNHISKGASFESFAKLHSQHPSYKDGGVTEWLTVNNPTLEMLDSLEINEVSEIYSNVFGLAIAIKIDERFTSIKLLECEERVIYKNAEKFYAKWLQNQREQASIKIYYDKL